MGCPIMMFVQFLSLYCRTLWSLYLLISLPCKTSQTYPKLSVGMLAPICSSLAICYQRTAGHQVLASRANYAHLPDDIRLELVPLCSSAPLSSWIYPRTAQWSKLECKNFTSLPPPGPTPILFVAPCQHMLGQVQLFPLFLDRSATPTIQYK